MATDEGALKLVSSWAEVPVKSIVAERAAAVHGDADRDHGAGVHLVAAWAVAQGVDDAAHCFLGVVLDVPHVRLDDVETEVLDHRGDLVDTFAVGGDLRAQVGEVGVRVAGGIRRPGEQRAVVSASRNRPFSTSSQLSKSTPSSSIVRLCAGMEPGVMPPISAWWPRDATKKRISSPGRAVLRRRPG